VIRTLGTLVLVLSGALSAGAAPPEGRIARLARGVNVPHWFWYPANGTPAGHEGYLGAADADALKNAGFTHVRLPVEPGWLWDENAAALRADRLAEYRRAVELFTSRAMGVVVDVHPGDTPWLKKFDGAATNELEKFWKALAGALADTDAELVLLELMNEPHDLADARVWNDAQVRLAARVRAAAPRHTIVCTGDSWGGIDGLARCAPIADDNVVYSFHFYEPHDFTHQGATWGFDAWKDMSGVPYPATPESLHKVAQGFSVRKAREALEWSAKHDPWDAAAIARRIEIGAAWGRDHHAPVYCGEFGAYRVKAPSEDRARWLSDVVGALEARGIGWAMWDYAGGFGLADGKPGERTLDPATLRALHRAK
jgi:endoglucanase